MIYCFCSYLQGGGVKIPPPFLLIFHLKIGGCYCKCTIHVLQSEYLIKYPGLLQTQSVSLGESWGECQAKRITLALGSCILAI